MDKQATVGFILIGVILFIWMWLQAPQPSDVPTPSKDSVVSGQVVQPSSPAPIQPAPLVQGSDSLGKFFSHLTRGTEKVVVIETDLYTAEISTRGGLIRKWELKEYKTWDQNPVQLIDYDGGGDLSLLFTSSDGKLVNTRGLFFNSDFSHWKKVRLQGDESFKVTLQLMINERSRIIKTLRFVNGKYSVEHDVEFLNAESVVANFEYQIIWETGLRYAERNSIEESEFAQGFIQSGGEIVEVDAADVGQTERVDVTGATSWAAAKTKYFAVALIPEEGTAQGAEIEGLRSAQPHGGVKENYRLGLKMPFRGRSSEKAKVEVFLGPLDYEVVTSYGRGLDQTMSLGAAWIIRPISEYVMLPLFQFLRMFIPNYGVVIIIFSLIIKLALHPLSKTSMKSMKKMQALQPMMTEIREKHKDDPQKMNHQIMTLYREYGVNPAAGCLPLLLQMPILFALYMVFRSSIELRQASFVWWIHDLSIPDALFKLPFTLPLFGITDVSGLALAMGITMFIQQKMTVTDPRQKAMVWMMPILMTLLFNSFPAGLNLYYFVFNLLSIGQQVWVNKHHGDEPPRKVDPKKLQKGIMGRLTKDLPKLK